MKWEAEKYPVLGSEKVTRHFAWLPVELTNGDTVWLEKYYRKWVVKQNPIEKIRNYWSCVCVYEFEGQS